MPDPNDPPSIRLADAAFRQAAVKVVRLAKQTGTPLILWVDGQIREVWPDELEEPTKPESAPSVVDRT